LQFSSVGLTAILSPMARKELLGNARTKVVFLTEIALARSLQLRLKLTPERKV